jgi:hypothetical protein
LVSSEALISITKCGQTERNYWKNSTSSGKRYEMVSDEGHEVDINFPGYTLTPSALQESGHTCVMFSISTDGT